MQLNLTLILSPFLLVAAQAANVAVSPAELAEARQWSAAKFEACPRLTSLALRPRADTVPMASCPGTKGNCVICHSLLSMERSEWQIPQYCTSISTCSSPSGPGS